MSHCACDSGHSPYAPESVKVHCVERNQPAVPLNSENLGHERGAFTGRRQLTCRPSSRWADRGTLFLDNWRHCHCKLHALLRVLPDVILRSVGARAPLDSMFASCCHQPGPKGIGGGSRPRDFRAIFFLIPPEFFRFVFSPLTRKESDIPDS